MKVLPVSRPCLGEEELAGVGSVFDSGWLGHGDRVLAFEERLGEMLGGRHVVAVSSGTAAMHLALDALEIGAGDEVIVPSFTFCGAVQAIIAVGARPVFCEIEPESLNVDVFDAARCVTPRTRAILPVHFCGNPCDMDALLEFARVHGIRVVEDAAHAFGSRYRGAMIGGFGDTTCFSFDPIKNITCGEGGAVVTADHRVADLLRRKRSLGMNRDGWARNTGGVGPGYDVDVQGYRYHMGNTNAAIGLAQLDRMDRFRARKLEIVDAYNARFEALDGLRILDWDTGCFPFSYMLRVMGGRRDALCEHLAADGVGTGVHYPPNHRQSYFSLFAHHDLPATDQAYREIVTLPLYCDMTDDDVDRVIGSVEGFCVVESGLPPKVIEVP